MSTYIDKYTILYDPLSYLCKERMFIASELTDAPQSRSIINNLIIEYYQLPVDDFNPDRESLYWIKLWTMLPDIALLLGCYYARQSLVRSGNLLKIPLFARRFIGIMPQCESKQSVRNKTSEDIMLTLTKIGYASLYSLTGDLPDTLTARLPLCFPEYVDHIDEIINLDRRILLMVFSYVEKNRRFASAHS